MTASAMLVSPLASPLTIPANVDLAAIKIKQQATWASGDFAVIGTTLQLVGESLCEAIDLRSTERVLDVACGNGNAALAAAHRFARVTGIDYVPELLAKAGRRAEAEGVSLELREADAEALPFADGSFDVVLSTFGVMFAPNHPVAAAEMVRVCRKGGRIGVASWTPTGFIGELLKTVGRHVPPPAGLMSPALWGKEEHVRALFEASATLEMKRREFVFRYESSAHFLDIFRRFYGPTHKAFAFLDADKQQILSQEIEALLAKWDRGGGRGLVIAAEYLEVIATKR